jgi:WD40 repeat protein
MLHFSCVTVIDDGSKALSGSIDGTFRVWNLDTSAHMKQDRSRSHVSGITVTPDGSRCVSASLDGTLKVWDCHTGKECYTLTGSQNCSIWARFPLQLWGNLTYSFKPVPDEEAFYDKLCFTITHVQKLVCYLLNKWVLVIENLTKFKICSTVWVNKENLRE